MDKKYMECVGTNDKQQMEKHIVLQLEVTSPQLPKGIAKLQLSHHDSDVDSIMNRRGIIRGCHTFLSHAPHISWLESKLHHFWTFSYIVNYVELGVAGVNLHWPGCIFNLRKACSDWFASRYPLSVDDTWRQCSLVVASCACNLKAAAAQLFGGDFSDMTFVRCSSVLQCFISGLGAKLYHVCMA